MTSETTRQRGESPSNHSDEAPDPRGSTGEDRVPHDRPAGELGSPEARLGEARKQVELAVAELLDEGEGRIPIIHEADERLHLVARDTEVRLIHSDPALDPTTRAVPFERADTILVAKCFEVLAYAGGRRGE